MADISRNDVWTLWQAIQNAVEGTIDVELTGSSAEVESAQDTQVATTVETYNRAAGATMMELYVESGYVRIRTDGSPASAITGEPLGEGFAGCWSVSALSVYYVGDSTITVVSR